MPSVQDVQEQLERKIMPAELAETEDLSPAPAQPSAEPDLTIEQLKLLLDKKLAALAKDEEPATEPPSPAPAGMMWLYNRGPDSFIWQYDGIVYELESHTMRLYPERVARHGKKRSLVSLDPVENTAVFRCALHDIEKVKDENGKVTHTQNRDKKFGVPLAVVNRLELIDRSTDDNPFGFPSRVPTQLKALKVGGSNEALLRRPDQFIELNAP